MNNEPTLALMYDRAVDEIALQLDTAFNFLCKYETLISQNFSVLDEGYEDINLAQSCFYSAIRRADSNSFAFFSIFRGSSFSDQLETIQIWTSKFNYSIDVFQSVEQYKTLIKHVADSMRSGTLEQPEPKKQEG